MGFENIGNDLADAYKQGIEDGKHLEKLVKLVEDWAEEKGIIGIENADKQFMKFVEEKHEFKTEMDFYTLFNMPELYVKDMMMEFGDIIVTLIILAKDLDIDFTECLEMAYNKIKNRNGKVINGTFVKEEDL